MLVDPPCDPVQNSTSNASKTTDKTRQTEKLENMLELIGTKKDYLK